MGDRVLWGGEVDNGTNLTGEEPRAQPRRGREDPADAHADALINDWIDAGRHTACPSVDGSRPLGRFRLIDDAAIEDLEPPEQQIDGLFPRGGLVVPYGSPGVLKTFQALDWAFCIATGFSWHGRVVQRGPVIFIAAEGGVSLGARVRAWKEYHGFAGRAGVHFITEPVLLVEPAQVDALLRVVGALEDPPALFVFDTLARCMAGYDENSTEAMGRFVAGADRLRREFGATVMVVHHTNAGGERERGNTALRGAADTMIQFKREADTVLLSCSKQKDAAPFSTIRVRFNSVGGASGVVLAATEARRVASVKLTESQLGVLKACHDVDGGEGVTMTAWSEVYDGGERTIYRARKVLLDAGFVEQRGSGRGSRWNVTEKGEEALSATLPTPCHEPARQGAPSLPATAGSFRTRQAGQEEQVESPASEW